MIVRSSKRGISPLPSTPLPGSDGDLKPTAILVRFSVRLVIVAAVTVAKHPGQRPVPIRVSSLLLLFQWCASCVTSITVLIFYDFSCLFIWIGSSRELALLALKANIGSHSKNTNILYGQMTISQVLFDRSTPQNLRERSTLAAIDRYVEAASADIRRKIRSDL